MLITFLNVSLKSQTLEKSWKLNFRLGAKDRIFVTSFCRKGYVFLLSNVEGKFQVFIEIHGLWLFLFVYEQDPGSLPLRGRLPIEFRANILQMII